MHEHQHVTPRFAGTRIGTYLGSYANQRYDSALVAAAAVGETGEF